MDIQEIYETYFTAVYRYILALSGDSQTAEEITQETFFKALKKLDTFRGDCELRVWLCQIAKNEYFQLLRKRKKEEFPGEEMLQSLPESDGFEQAMMERETYMQVQKILHHMEEPYKEVFSLRTFSELSFREIAELFDRSESWARVIYYRAKIKVKERLGHEHNM
ncbi:MAG: sigma-70 family RNA polymerase sigma factor [Clostridium sp.]|nr:sigma-70 family RNA polymerase sigma factor [Clostridium sp.]